MTKTPQDGAVDLYWLPLGAGGHSVRFNGIAYEAAAAVLGHRPARDLYHSALEVRVPEGRFVIEQAPVPDNDGAQRGVVATGPVGSSYAGHVRIFRYELRRWRDGVIPARATRIGFSRDSRRAAAVWSSANYAPGGEMGATLGQGTTGPLGSKSASPVLSNTSRTHAYLAIGINDLGVKDVLGLWITKGEGAKQWLAILTELKNRGVEDVLVCCVDGLKGFPDAIEAIWPDTIVQTCIVHMIRNSLRFVSYKDRRRVAKELRPIYAAPTDEAALAELDAFASVWDARYPMITQGWRANWERVTPFLAFPPELRRIVYTTNQIEALNSKLRTAIRIRGHFPDQDAARKLIYLQIRQLTARWDRPSPYWPAAIATLAVHYPDRIYI